LDYNRTSAPHLYGGQGPGEACELQLDSQYTRKKSYKQWSFLKKDSQKLPYFADFPACFDFTLDLSPEHDQQDVGFKGGL
jgi:hypothetical protein